MTVYRPSAQALLWIRVDELADTAQFDQLVASQASGVAAIAGGVATQPVLATAAQLSNPATALNGITESMQQLESNRRDGAVSEAQYQIARRNLEASRELLLEEQQAPSDQPRPWMLLGASPDRRYGRFGIQPLNVEIEKNGYRTADTASMTIDWRTLPFDPRIVRSAAVEMVIGVIDEQRFADGVAGVIDPATGLPVSVMTQNPGAPSVASSTRFCGWVDEWGISYGDNNTVDLQFRDFTCLFLDTPLSSDAVLDLNLPIDKAIRVMLAQYPTLAGFAVRYVPVPGVRSSEMAPACGRAVPVTGRSRRGRTANATRSGDQRMSVWDQITDACIATGLVPVVRDYELQIVRPSTQYRTEDVRRMVYGRNLKGLEFSRKLGGTKVPTIEVRCYDPTIGRTRWARWPVPPGSRNAGVLGRDAPPRALRANELTPTGTRVDERIQTYVIKPTTDPLSMVAAARSLFEQIGRQEIEGNLETNDVASWDIEADRARPTEKADLLEVQIGEALELLIAPQERAHPEDAATTPGEWIAMERGARTRFLMTLGMSQSVAENIAALQDVVSSMLFRVQSAKISFDADEGINVQIDFANFIEVRETRPTSAIMFEDEELLTPDQAARQAAHGQSVVEGIANEILKSSLDRQTALSQAMTASSPTGSPQTVEQRIKDLADRAVADQIAVTGIGGD